MEEFDRWHAVAKIAIRESEPLLHEALNALMHYRDQTRPIADCDTTIARLRARLGL